MLWMIVSFLDCHVKPCLKQLHLTLAHKFYPHHQKTLEQLAKCINPGEACQWVAALYSRDMRFVHYQVLSPDIFNFLSPLSDSLLQSSCLFFMKKIGACTIQYFKKHGCFKYLFGFKNCTHKSIEDTFMAGCLTCVSARSNSKLQQKKLILPWYEKIKETENEDPWIFSRICQITALQ